MILISMVLANDHAFFSNTTLNCWRRWKGGGGGGVTGINLFSFPFFMTSEKNIHTTNSETRLKTCE